MNWSARYKREKNNKKEIKVKNANCNISEGELKGMKSLKLSVNPIRSGGGGICPWL